MAVLYGFCSITEAKCENRFEIKEDSAVDGDNAARQKFRTIKKPQNLDFTAF